MAKAIFLTLALLYGVGALAAGFVIMHQNELHLSSSMQAAFVHAVMLQALIAFLCAGSFVLAVRANRLADVASAITAFFTALVALTPLILSIRRGFKAYNLVEIVLVLPCVAFIFLRLLRKRVPKFEIKPNGL